MAGWASDLAGWASGMAGWASGLAGCPRGGGTEGRTDNLPILQSIGAAALPPPMKTKEKVEQGKGTLLAKTTMS